MGNLCNGPGQFRCPGDIAINRDGFAYVTDMCADRVQVFTLDGAFVTTWGSHGALDGQFDVPEGITTDNDGHVLVADRKNCRVQRFTATGEFVSSIYVGGFPIDVSVLSDDLLLMTSHGNLDVFRFSGKFVWGPRLR